jgi:hypothetical protein
VVCLFSLLAVYPPLRETTDLDLDLDGDLLVPDDSVLQVSAALGPSKIPWRCASSASIRRRQERDPMGVYRVSISKYANKLFVLDACR